MWMHSCNMVVKNVNLSGLIAHGISTCIPVMSTHTNLPILVVLYYQLAKICICIYSASGKEYPYGFTFGSLCDGQSQLC